MSAPVIVRAAAEFLREDAKRKARPKLTQVEKGELSLTLNILAGAVPSSTDQARAMRGEAAVALFGYEDTFDEAAADVIADVMHALRRSGYDPLQVLAHARAYYFKEVPEAFQPAQITEAAAQLAESTEDES